MGVLLLRFRRGDVSRIRSLWAHAGADLFEALESDECYLYQASPTIGPPMRKLSCGAPSMPSRRP